MMEQATLTLILLLLSCYLAGSIPSGFILGKIIKRIDIRKHGSGNVGATNVFRVLGWRLGIIALLFDMLKGLIAVIAARNLFPAQTYVILSCGAVAILGHIFSVFLKFRGGKGVATSAGVFIALTPPASAIALGVFVIVAAISKYVSAGSIAASVALVLAQLVFSLNNGFRQVEYFIITIIIAFFIIYKHKSNIKRLIDGTENKINFKKKSNTG